MCSTDEPKKPRKWRWLSRRHWERIEKYGIERGSPAWRSYWMRHHIIWAPINKRKKEAARNRTYLYNRERKWVELFFYQLTWLLTHHTDHKDLKRLIRFAGVLCLKPAGYRRNYLNKNGEPTKLAVKQFNELQARHSIQVALIERFANAGFTPDEADAALISLIRDDDKSVKLAALKQYYTLTVPKEVNKKVLKATMDVTEYFADVKSPPPMELE